MRNFTPPVHVDVHDGEVDAKPVIIARVHECDVAHKPWRAPDGKAYVRSWVGDYAASEREERAFLMQRTHQRVDSNPVPTAAADELDPAPIALWREGVDGDDPSGLGRFAGDEQLRRGGILTAGGQPTLGGLLALGIRLQQFFPSPALQLLNSSPTGGRARNPAVPTTPLPIILDQALELARLNFMHDVVTNADSRARDVYERPLVALRELAASAVVHRSFDEWAVGYTAEVRLTDNRLVVSSPGGLLGITTDRLGHEKMTTSRNSAHVAIARHAVSPRSRARVIGRLSTGITTVFEECDAAGLPRQIFQDTGVRFNAILRKSARPPTLLLGKTKAAACAALVTGTQSVTELAAQIGTGAAHVRKVLRTLREPGLVAVAGKGRRTTYRRSIERS